MIRFVFGRRVYTLHLREPETPRWSYTEYGFELAAGGYRYNGLNVVVPVVGQRSGNRYLDMDLTELDFDQRFGAKMKSVAVAPAGRSGECTFPAVYLTITHTMAVTLRLTPYVDGVAKASKDVVLTTKATRTQAVIEVGFAEPLVDGVEQGKFYLRGTWFSLQIETLVDAGGLVPGIATGDLLFEEAAVEYEAVTETRVAV